LCTASVIAVFTRFSISAPVKPGVICANFLGSMSPLFEILFRYNSKISVLPLRSGWGTCIFLSKRPGLTAAGSSES